MAVSHLITRSANYLILYDLIFSSFHVRSKSTETIGSTNSTRTYLLCKIIKGNSEMFTFFLAEEFQFLKEFRITFLASNRMKKLDYFCERAGQRACITSVPLSKLLHCTLYELKYMPTLILARDTCVVTCLMHRFKFYKTTTVIG